MFDIHTHILPNMDDGSKSIEETMQILSIMHKQGVKKVVATPHYYSEEPIDEFLERRRAAYDAIGQRVNMSIPKIVLGAEVLLSHGIYENPDLRKLCIGNTDYMLIEMPYQKWDDWMLDEIFKISAKHHIEIIIAHIDRYEKVAGKSKIDNLMEMDVKFQVNVDDLQSFWGTHLSLEYLRKYNIDFIGTDCHNMTHRKPCMGIAAKKIKKHFGQEFIDKLMDNAENMLENKKF